MDTNKAFDVLTRTGQAELDKVKEAGAAFFAQGDTAQVRVVADQVEKIQALLEALRQLQSRWLQVMPEPATINPPLPLNNPAQRTPAGRRTPQESYRLPILQALVEMRGKGRTDRVLDRVGELMVDILNDVDHELLPNRRDYRWRNTAMWERLEMVKDGLLSDRSPKGTWEITEAGREYLARRK